MRNPPVALERGDKKVAVALGGGGLVQVGRRSAHDVGKTRGGLRILDRRDPDAAPGPVVPTMPRATVWSGHRAALVVPRVPPPHVVKVHDPSAGSAKPTDGVVAAVMTPGESHVPPLCGFQGRTQPTTPAGSRTIRPRASSCVGATRSNSLSAASAYQARQ